MILNFKYGHLGFLKKIIIVTISKQWCSCVYSGGPSKKMYFQFNLAVWG